MSKKLWVAMFALMLAGPVLAEETPANTTGTVAPIKPTVEAEQKDLNTLQFQKEFRERLEEQRKEAAEREKKLMEERRAQVKNLQEDLKTDTRAIKDDAKANVRALNNQLPANTLRCGGIAGAVCPEGLRCKLEGSFPDAMGVCVKEAADIKAFSEEARKLIEAKREAAKHAIEIKREEFKHKLETVKEEARATHEKIKEELKDKLEAIKDVRKKDIVERLDERMDELNHNRAEHYANVLEKIEKALAHLISRTEKAAANGHDVSAVRAAITEAEAAIKTAREAIAAQAAKTYAFDITDEATLKQKIGEARRALETDLKKVHEAIKAAHEAVRKAVIALAGIPGVDGDATSATTTPPATTPPAATTTPAATE